MKTRVLVGSVWYSKDRRTPGRSIIITDRLRDGRFKADSYNPKNTHAKHRVVRTTLSASTVLKYFHSVLVEMQKSGDEFRERMRTSQRNYERQMDREFPGWRHHRAR